MNKFLILTYLIFGITFQSYSQICDQSIPVTHSEITKSELDSLLSTDGISGTLDGNYAYKITVNAGGGAATHTEMAICLDGISPIDGFVQGKSDATDARRTKIGIIGVDTLEFNGQGWIDASGYIENPNLYMELDSKWGSNIDTYIDFWFVANEQIDTLGYILLDDYDDDFGSITIDGYHINTIPFCDQSIPVTHSEITKSELDSLLSTDGISGTLDGNYAYKITVNAGGGAATHTEMAICLDGISPIDGFVQGRSDATDARRTKIGIIGVDTLEFNGQGWIDASGYIENPNLYMELDSKWGSNIDTYIDFWFVANEQIDTLGYILLDDYDDDFGSITIDGYQIDFINSVFSNNKIPISEFKLLQNYPNPFNPLTRINYHLGMPNNVELKIYSINGQEIETLVNRYQSAGNYSVVFHADGLASGIYIYNLNVGTFEQNRKMILLR